MARPLRLEHAGAIWHVTARGNRKEGIVLEDEDRQRWLHQLATTVEVYRWRVFAWVLMTNHYHLLLETPEPNLTRGMHRLNGPYAQRFNKRHGRVGHLFQGRYKAILGEAGLARARGSDLPSCEFASAARKMADPKGGAMFVGAEVGPVPEKVWTTDTIPDRNPPSSPAATARRSLAVSAADLVPEQFLRHPLVHTRNRDPLSGARPAAGPVR